MAVDKLVDSIQLDSNLTSVANAIRSKSGYSGTLAFPTGFVSEIGDIEISPVYPDVNSATLDANSILVLSSGVTPTGTKQINISANGTTTEDVTNYASAEIIVAVPQPSGSTTVTDNGTYNISQYASVVVAVPAASGVSF